MTFFSLKNKPFNFKTYFHIEEDSFEDDYSKLLQPNLIDFKLIF